MIFNRESGCVKVWISLIIDEIYTIEQIPKLFNLKECVINTLKDMNYIR